jgi:phosphoenolpyruvate carboxykinase (ATP)
VLNPENVWTSKEDYGKTVKKLATLFQENFKNYASLATKEVIAAGPKI